MFLQKKFDIHCISMKNEEPVATNRKNYFETKICPKTFDVHWISKKRKQPATTKRFIANKSNMIKKKLILRNQLILRLLRT